MREKTKGITLVALIITIIVMLILVGVSVQVVINSDLIGTVQNAADRTETQYLEESKAGSLIEVEGKKYLSMEDYMAGIERAPEIMEGEGTEENPYTIDSIEALVQFAHSVTNGKTYEGEYVKLTKNLDFKSAESYLNATRTDYAEYGYTGELMTALTTGEGWKPIGTTISNSNDSNNCFKGIFDGNGKSVNNLFIDRNIQSLEESIIIGFFSRNYGTIKNLGITNANIKIIAAGDAGKALMVGGIIGQNWKEINGCYTTGTAYIEANNTCTMRFGGITSQLRSESSTVNCYNNMDISTKHYSTGSYYVGGIIAYGYENTSISGCYNAGTIEGVIDASSSNIYCGGIVGGVADISISNSYNLAEIELEGTVKNSYLGGIVGHNQGTIKNVCNTGNIVSTITKVGSYNVVGGIAGLNYNSKIIENAYYLSSTSTAGAGKNWGTADISSIDNIDNMPTVLEIIGEGFKADVNGGYPILKWQ